MIGRSLSRRFRAKLKHGLLAVLFGCLVVIPICWSYPTHVWQLEGVSKTAAILATIKVEHVSKPGLPLQSGSRTVPGHVELVVLRSFPPLALWAGQHIQLEYETLAEGNSGMSGPDVPYFQQDAILIVPLKPNPKAATEAWRLIAEEGGGIVIPAIDRESLFPGNPKNAREYLLQDVAAALSIGTREELLREASYLSGQVTNGFAADLMKLLTPVMSGNSERWALISASLVSCLGTPRPTIEDFRASKYGKDFTPWRGSLVEASVQKALSFRGGKESLIHQFLTISDLALWGPGGALQEYAQEPVLVKELDVMLEARRPGSLYVAYDVMKAGQNKIRATATRAALAYVNDPSKNRSELQAACWVIRDFGTVAQFKQLLRTTRKYQYENPKHYDELWRNTIWSDNDRERAVLEILLADQRIYDGGERYSDIARNELARLSKIRPSAQ